MIENSNRSKEPSNGEYIDIRKFIGVGSVNIVAINPNNAKLREFGWSIPEDTDEPKYIVTTEKDGKEKTSTRIRFMCKVMDLEEKPIIPVDFWIGNEIMVNRDGDKCKIIDSYVRTAWATKEDVKAHRVPQYKNGPASINSDYKACHRGEEELCSFLFKYLNITPLQMFDRRSGNFVPSKNPGKLTIDNWKALCAGDVRELVEYIASEPDNRVKVIFGLRITEDNKSYQTFLNTTYIGNGAAVDRQSGEYVSARKAIDKFFSDRQDAPFTFLATPIKEWKEEASTVSDNSSQTMFDEHGNFNEETSFDDDDLPFD